LLGIGDRIAVSLHCPVIEFSPEQVALRIEDRLNKASFVGIPVESCMPGKHDAVATIVDAQTKDGYESIEFTIKIVDYAFDHVSTPFMSKVSSAFLGIVSAGSFVPERESSRVARRKNGRIEITRDRVFYGRHVTQPDFIAEHGEIPAHPAVRIDEHGGAARQCECHLLRHVHASYRPRLDVRRRSIIV
jgi:hypothetical protein